MISNKPSFPFSNLGGYDAVINVSQRPTVIISFGAAFSVLGYGGEVEPRWVIPSDYTNHDFPEITYSFQDILKLLQSDSSRRHGADAISSFVEQIFMRFLLINPSNTRVIVLENMTSNYRFKQTLATILFRRFQVPVLQFVPAQPLALIPLEHNSGMIVDVGYSETNIIPVSSGCTMFHALKSVSLGAVSIHSQISALLNEYACIIPKDYILEESVNSDPDSKPIEGAIDSMILEDLFRQTCFVSRRLKKATLQTSEDSESTQIQPNSIIDQRYVPYMDRNGTMYRISQKVRSQSAEILFCSENENEAPTIPGLILSSLLDCSIDLRVKLAHKIVLIGGVSMMRGFKERLMQEIEFQVLNNPKFESLRALHGHFEFISPKKLYPPHLSWIGASIDSTIDQANVNNQITLQEFVEGKKAIPDWTSLTSNKKMA